MVFNHCLGTVLASSVSLKVSAFKKFIIFAKSTVGKFLSLIVLSCTYYSPCVLQKYDFHYLKVSMRGHSNILIAREFWIILRQRKSSGKRAGAQYSWAFWFSSEVTELLPILALASAILVKTSVSPSSFVLLTRLRKLPVSRATLEKTVETSAEPAPTLVCSPADHYRSSLQNNFPELVVKKMATIEIAHILFHIKTLTLSLINFLNAQILNQFPKLCFIFSEVNSCKGVT